MIFTIHKTFLLHKNTRFTKFSKFYTVHVIPSDPTAIRVCWMRERGLNHFGFRVKKPHKQVCKATPSPSPALGPSGASPEKGRPVYGARERCGQTPILTPNPLARAALGSGIDSSTDP